MLGQITATPEYCISTSYCPLSEYKNNRARKENKTESFYSKNVSVTFANVLSIFKNRAEAEPMGAAYLIFEIYFTTYS